MIHIVYNWRARLAIVFTLKKSRSENFIKQFVDLEQIFIRRVRNKSIRHREPTPRKNSNLQRRNNNNKKKKHKKNEQQNETERAFLHNSKKTNAGMMFAAK